MQTHKQLFLVASELRQNSTGYEYHACVNLRQDRANAHLHQEACDEHPTEVVG